MWTPAGAQKKQLINGTLPSGDWSHIVSGGAVQTVSMPLDDLATGFELYGEITNATGVDADISIRPSGLTTDLTSLVSGHANTSLAVGARSADGALWTVRAGTVCAVKIECLGSKSGSARIFKCWFNSAGAVDNDFSDFNVTVRWAATTALTSMVVRSSIAASIANGSRFKFWKIYG